MHGLMGDFNINLLNIETHLPSSEFLDTLYSKSFFPLISKPTRVSENTATLIDNIFCNSFESSSSISGILYTHISDHFPVFTIAEGVRVISEKSHVNCRNFAQSNINNFVTRLQSQDWNEIYSTKECREAYTLFNEKFTKCYNESFPLKYLNLVTIIKKLGLLWE